ncbi:DNA primase DnaG [Gottschalkia acidurici 9a]|uniref:DNA primase n=1 Tax=Gottschalkia acidurici (strain ATCC 7906 / DSM 604 / BCRC 14475 / CIP 104303 / KCTC 5404 / NCIMB 10678 / 9a) TaxID=1128398 RepID=K0B2G6_GOTA9|nr:DNA primase [Gottschalkia acidurici]AFS78811.1 DNA primase DnaG [Gottschalkia acidurici 9a]
MTYLYDEDVISEVRESNNIVDIISQYVDLKKVGSNYKGICPFHSERTPSFVVSDQKQMYHCFGCGEGGDVISFIMKQENIEFIEALESLADRVNIRLEGKRKTENVELDKTKDTLYEINREAGIYFYRNLFKERRAYHYLINRGIDQKTIKTFGLGYSLNSWNSLLNYLKNKNYKEEDIEKAGLIIKHRESGRYYDRFRDRIIFPIINTRGKVIGFGGRSIDSKNQPKYLNSPDTNIFLKGNNLYALNIAKKYNKNEKIILVEGYMDVISLYKHGINYAVASLGTALTPNQGQLLKRYSKEIYICYDSDQAGINAANKGLDVMKEIGIGPKIISLPDGMDPDDYIKINGIEKFKYLISESLTAIDFRINQKKKLYDINNHEGKINFIKEASLILKEIKSPVELEVYINKLSMEVRILPEVIKREVYKDLKPKDKYINNNYRYNNKDNIVPVQYMLQPGHLTAEKELLNLIINNKSIYLNIKEKFKSEDFSDNIYSKLANITYELYENDENIDSIKILNKFDENDKAKVKDVLSLQIKINEASKIKAIEDYIKNINYYKISMKKEQIKKQINMLDNKEGKTEEDMEKINQLCLELIHIDKQLKINQ